MNDRLKPVSCLSRAASEHRAWLHAARCGRRRGVTSHDAQLDAVAVVGDRD